MAIITRIRQLSGLVIGAIAFSMLLFIIGGDLLSANSSILQLFNRDSVAEIDGITISPKEFSDQVTVTSRELEMLQFGRPPGESEMEYVRYNALNELIYKLAFQKEFDKLGITVTAEEMEDMIQGNNIDPSFAQQFTDPKTGELDRNQIVGFLKQLPTLPAQQQEYFRYLESYIARTRLRKKYNNLLASSNYASKQEAQAYHNEINSKRSLKYVFVPYNSIPDSAIKINDGELQAFFGQHKGDYKRKENRAIEYVAFPLKPSAKDTASIIKELTEQKGQLQTAEDAKAFADANSDVPNAVTSFKPGELPQVLASLTDSLKPGVVVGPFQTGGAFAIYRVVDTNDDSVFSMKASHILFGEKGAADSVKRKSKQDAERVLREVQAGADFAMMAAQYSTDQSNKYQGGDLGWFSEKTMVAPFEQAVINATREGVLPSLVETEFGYHLIKVTAVKTKKRFNIAAIARTISVSDETRAQAYSAAGAFATAKTAKEYVEKVQAAKMVSLQALTIPRDAKNINNLSGNKVREVVRWVYNEAKLGDVSRVFELDDQYIVAISRTPSTEEGEPTLADVKDEVLVAYRKAEKAKQIMNKLNQVKGGNLEEIKKGYGDKAELVEQGDLNISTSGLNIAGYAPLAIGYAFAMEKGERSKPFKDESGVFILEVTNIDAASEVADYTSQKKALSDRRKAQIEEKVLKAMRKLANVKDNIAKYY
jgi:peptidyl-prolyl cis-trans isomerase D